VVLVDARLIYLDDALHDYVTEIDECGEYLIVVSRHRSESGGPNLLVHTPGNWDRADAGGAPRTLAVGSGQLTYYLFKHLTEENQESGLTWPVDMEVTHHGPTGFSTPMAFIELGSSEEWYSHEAAARVVARAVLRTVTTLDAGDRPRVCIGFGGTHYTPNFSRKILNGYALAHVCPKYFVGGLDAAMIEHLMARVAEPVGAFLLDWKGLSSADKTHLMALLEPLGLPIIKTHQIS
jgi:D-aminoacyl-tRNA deacylase